MSVRLKVYGFLGLVVLVAGAAIVYKTKPDLFGGVAQANSTKDAGANGAKDKEQTATPVELALAKRDRISSYVTATANLRALRDVAVATQAEGIVQKVLAEEGDFARQGQVLAMLDDTKLRIQLELAEEKLGQAQIQIEKARIRRDKTVAQIGHAQIELERYTKAAKEGLVSEKEVAAYRYKVEELQHDEKVAASEMKELEHRVGELKAEIAQCKLDIERTHIRAPYDGFITQRTVNIGQRVRAMDSMFSIGSFSPLYADVYLSELDTRSVRPGQVATIRLGSDETATVSGRVERLAPIVDQATGTVKVTVELPPKNGFRPGAFVRVDIQTDSKSGAILIPKRALIEEDGQYYVYIAGSDTASRTKVDVGYQSEGMVEIRNGVQEGEKVVVAGQGALKEGSKIKPIQS